MDKPVESGSTDDENELKKPHPRLWEIYEQDVRRRIADIDPKAEVTHNAMVPGLISGTVRQVDVLVRGHVGGEEMVIAIECKRYAKKIGIGKVDEFAGKLADLGVDRGILYAFSGITEPARTRAGFSHPPKISIGNLGAETPALPDWHTVVPEVEFPTYDVLSFGDCPNVNCSLGNIEWQEWTQPSGEIVHAGACDVEGEGTWAVRCPTCGAETAFFWNIQECDGCDRKFAKRDEPNGGTEIIAV